MGENGKQAVDALDFMQQKGQNQEASQDDRSIKAIKDIKAWRVLFFDTFEAQYQSSVPLEKRRQEFEEFCQEYPEVSAVKKAAVELMLIGDDKVLHYQDAVPTGGAA